MHSRFKRRISGFFRGLDFTRRVILSLIFWGLIIALIIGISGMRPGRVKDGTVLVLRPYGAIVDTYSTPMSYRGLPVGGYASETLLSDLVASLEIAAEDPKISGVHLSLDNLYGTGAAMAGEFAAALMVFRESGKTIIGSADTYDTSRYRIASAANLIVVDRLGEVFPTGYGYWRAYYAEGLEKLGAEASLFRSGESKTGAENFIRNNMSDAARRDENRLLGDLWTLWLESVAEGRQISSSFLSEWIEAYDRMLGEAQGDASLAALGAGLVDRIETGGVLESLLEEHFGSEFPRMEHYDYLSARSTLPERKSSIAIIPIVGTLVYGEGAAGTAGSDELISSIVAARETPGVKALVLRVDSPGGDVRAGEAVRRVLEETRRDWKLPIVASMGNLAASGGYWIALESDRIVSRPETITGSIGVYSVSVSFEQALAKWLGIRIDGVGTTPWSGSYHPGRTMDERTASLYEWGVTDIDTMFRTLVSEKRGLDPDVVSQLAGGIPWSGERAMKLGLVDELGGLGDAGESAAELAGLDDWQTLWFDAGVDPRQEILGRIIWGRRVERSAGARWQFPKTLYQFILR